MSASSPEAVLADRSKQLPSKTLTPPQSPRLPSTTSDIEIVIAHYNEDLTWLSAFAASCHIYSKGDPPKPSSPSTSTLDSGTQPHFTPSLNPYKSLTSLPNIGRETHTYLTHIITHYSTLPPYLLLLQGDIHTINHGTPAHTSLSLSEIISLTTQLSPLSILPIGLINPFSSWSSLIYKEGWIERRGSTLKRSKLNPGEFYRLIFGNTAEDSSSPTRDLPNGQLPASVNFVQGACFGVTRDAILRRPKIFYERVLKYFEDLDEVNPEEGHYMERFWYVVLSDDAIISDGKSGGGDGDEDEGGKMQQQR